MIARGFGVLHAWINAARASSSTEVVGITRGGAGHQARAGKLKRAQTKKVYARRVSDTECQTGDDTGDRRATTTLPRRALPKPPRPRY